MKSKQELAIECIKDYIKLAKKHQLCQSCSYPWHKGNCYCSKDILPKTIELRKDTEHIKILANLLRQDGINFEIFFNFF